MLYTIISLVVPLKCASILYIFYTAVGVLSVISAFLNHLFTFRCQIRIKICALQWILFKDTILCLCLCESAELPVVAAFVSTVIDTGDEYFMKSN